MIGANVNQPQLEGLRLNVPAYVKNQRLISWVADIAALAALALLVEWLDWRHTTRDLSTSLYILVIALLIIPPAAATLSAPTSCPTGPRRSSGTRSPR